MALVLADRVEQVTRTTGLGDLQLAETIRGRQSFQEVTNNGDTVIYVLEDSEGMEWEIGEGTVVHGTETTLQRTTIRQSSNSDTKISLSVGTHRVFLVVDAQYINDIVSGASITQGDLDQAIDDHNTDATAHSDATTSARGFMSAADKTKLDGVETGATADQSAAEVPYSNATSGLTATDVQAAVDEVDGDLDAHIGAGDPHPQYTTTAEASAAAPVQSVNGESGTVLLDATDVGATPSSHVGTGGAQHADATTSVSGFMSGADKTKLDTVEANAKDDQSAAEVAYSNATSGLTATDVQAAIDELRSVPVKTVSGTSYTLLAADVYHYLRFTNASAVTVTVPSGSAFAVGGNLSLVQAGAGTVTVSPAVGVTINSADAMLASRVQFSAMTLTKVGADEWDLTGDLA